MVVNADRQHSLLARKYCAPQLPKLLTEVTNEHAIPGEITLGGAVDVVVAVDHAVVVVVAMQTIEAPTYW